MKVEIKVPEIGESISEVTLSSWLVEDGAIVELDQPICEFESDKATLEMPSEAAGKLIHVAKEGDDIEVGGLVCYIDTSVIGEASSSTKEEKKDEVVAPAIEEKPIVQAAPVFETATYATAHPSPAAKKILDEKGVDAGSIKGSGIDGRITKEDALNAKVQQPVAIPTPQKEVEKPLTVSSPPPVATIPGSRNERVEKMSRLRKTVSKRLVEVKNKTAMLTTFNEVDLTRVMEMRKQYKDDFSKEHDISLGFMSFFIKASTKALQKFEAINAYLDEEAGEIIYHDYCDVSIAVSTPKGLVVPVIRNAENLSFAGIEKEVKRLAVAGRDGKLTLEEMNGGTFTITNGGVFGSLLSTPIINQPQSAILGMHTIQQRPMVVNGEIVARPMMYLALSYDHRIVDGKEAVSFLVAIKNYLENPEKILLDL
ncbi:MAG: 2-oxoglutarate dehydrogenase complex dihydrolipoyllysine-residue succinyltransferase [Chitinophagales bacterium]|nr:2-oxoglutarate dehydrogenase complex dihydrolipoyllysine-residue succinyltransferase [Chitinophagales bacterium]